MQNVLIFFPQQQTRENNAITYLYIYTYVRFISSWRRNRLRFNKQLHDITRVRREFREYIHTHTKSHCILYIISQKSRTRRTMCIICITNSTPSRVIMRLIQQTIQFTYQIFAYARSDFRPLQQWHVRKRVRFDESHICRFLPRPSTNFDFLSIRRSILASHRFVPGGFLNFFIVLIQPRLYLYVGRRRLRRFKMFEIIIDPIQKCIFLYIPNFYYRLPAIYRTVYLRPIYYSVRNYRFQITVINVLGGICNVYTGRGTIYTTIRQYSTYTIQCRSFAVINVTTLYQ